MDQQSPSDVLPSVELPKPELSTPTPEQPFEADLGVEKASSQLLEKGVSVPVPQAQVMPPQPAIPQTAPLVAPHDAPPNGVVGVTATPQIADDTDLIEKEWVEKAKQIVNRTRHDPHLQTKEMNGMKADYLKKRYNKDLKQSE